jgi:hypothetical protein
MAEEADKNAYQTQQNAVHKEPGSANAPNFAALKESKLKLTRSNFTLGHSPSDYKSVQSAEHNQKPLNNVYNKQY